MVLVEEDDGTFTPNDTDVLVDVHGVQPGNVLKCLLLKGRDGTVVAVMTPGDVRIDVKMLERLIGVKKLSFMPAGELKDRLGQEPGGVDPLILPEVAEMVVADSSLLGRGFVIGSAGSRFCGLKVKPKELLRAMKGVQIMDISAE
jgi:prolyl-tRNA editing enzyme YbaK/EbsC (Cys-tRNA(Pro) deacylase)